MKSFWLIVATVFLANQVIGTYVITTPRRWPSEGLVQICASLLDDAVFDPNVDEWFVTIKDSINNKEILNKTQLSMPAGRKMVCRDVRRPRLETKRALVQIEGKFAGTSFSEEVNVTVGGKVFKTFIQPDKAIYKPGQKVQFRLLSIKDKVAPFVFSSPSGIWKQPYALVYIETPSRVRIAQWRNVSNNGLVHLSMDLHDEAEQGRYRITVEHGLDFSREKKFNEFGTLFSESFEVKYYTLPRYEVTVSSPQIIYGNSSKINLKLCAKYTFGQNVKGNGSLSVSVGSYNRLYANITKHALVDGCKDFIFSNETLRFDDNNCHIRISSIKVHGNVAEEGTNNIIYLKPTTFLVHRRVITFTDVTKVGIRKNYLPIQLTIEATFPDSKVAANEKIEACSYVDSQNICRNFTTDTNGRLEILMPSEHNNGIQFRAVNYPPLERNFNFVMEESARFVYRRSNDIFTKVHNASISIYYFDKLQCEDGKQINVTLPLIYVTDGQKTADIKVQTMSKGYVYSLYNETIEIKNTPLPFNYQRFLAPLAPVPNHIIRGMTNISFTLPLTVSPQAVIIVWFKTLNNSVVADTLTLDVTPCLGNDVDFSWSVNKTEPGMPVKMVVTAEQNSLCSIGVVDKSVELLGKAKKISVHDILNAVNINSPREWDENQLNLNFCLKKYKNENAAKEIAAHPTFDVHRSVRLPYRSEIEAIQVFKDAGYHVFSPLNLEKESCDGILFKALKSLANKNTFLNRGKPPVALAQEGSKFMAGAPMKVSFDSVSSPVGLSISNKEGTVTEEVTRERVFFPETWLWDLRTLESNELSETVTLPDTITEWIGSAVCIGRETGVGISNEASITTFTPFFVELNLPEKVKRGEHFPVIISIFSYSRTSLSVNLQLEKSPDFEFVDVGGKSEDGSRKFCLDKFQKFTRTIIINPKIIGDLNITVEALSNREIPNCFDPSEPLKSDRIIKPVTVEAEGVTRERVWSKYVCPEDFPNKSEIWNLTLPTDIVKDSERAWIHAIGDLLGPSLKNIGSLVNMPYGCGEQNLITFVPNVFILDYLNASNQLVPELEEKLKRFMNFGYQRQLRFARNDGSFSTFGEIDKTGSTWLTAFVLKGFSQSSRYIHIDKTLMEKSINFLMNNQMPNGCFQENGKVINKVIQGGDVISQQSLLTAYVLSALVESSHSARIQLNAINESVITESLSCINRDSSIHPYNLALKAYSLSLAGSPEAENLIKQLLVLAVTDESEMRWAIPGKVKNSALGVETASYALLALLISDEKLHLDNSRKIVRWLSSQRNGRGGFVSTQDTIVALHALSLFERLLSNKAVNITVTANNTKFDHIFKIHENNKLVEQRQDIPSPPETVSFHIQGTGCALIQGVLRYNVLSTTSDEYFSVNVSSPVDDKCEYHNITTCVSYLLSDKASNMANIEVELVTGYNPVEADLQEVVLNEPFKRYEIDQRKVIFYLDEITATPVCASFRVKQDLIVGNVQPGVVKVYDYYQPELFGEKTYNLTACKTSYVICIDPITNRPVNTQDSNNDLC